MTGNERYSFKNILLCLTFLTTLLLSPLALSAGQSLRKCVLLPITDVVGGAIGLKVFENLEEYLKNSNWCYYRPNSEIINILKNYNQNLESHLNTKTVIKAIGEKVRAGSLIRINLKPHMEMMDVEVSVIGDDGEDLYFKEKTTLGSSDVGGITQTIKNWLEVYSKTIPYDGQVVGILGDQFTIDLGKNFRVRVGTPLIVLRPGVKRAHPLLKEVVEWTADEIGRAKVFNVSDLIARSKLTQVEYGKKIAVGDWVRVDRVADEKTAPVDKYENVKTDDFGKLGIVGLSLEYGQGTVASTKTKTVKTEGNNTGLNIFGEIWATRNFWAGLDVGRKFGTYRAKGNNAVASKSNATVGVMRAKAGYKYLPMGFFYGPQLDGYIGYASYTHDLEYSASDALGKNSITGLLLGARGSLPLFNQFRLFTVLEIMPFPTYKEDDPIFGSADSTKSILLEFGVNYLYNPVFTVDGSLQFISNGARFSGSQQFTYNDTGVKVGVTYSY